MEMYKISDLSFKYPNCDKNAVSGINLSVKKGEFVTVCGKSGCGKTTLLRLLKPVISPFGDKEGQIIFCGQDIEETELKEQTKKIGFVMQNPDNQIVTDKVWHELCFGLESLGIKTPIIRAKVAEIASFFGIENWFYKKTDELSGGQKQILNLASVMVMEPDVLILDEPTSQLDPIAAKEFLQLVKRVNRELGMTVILAEHRLEEAVAISDRIVVMDRGEILADATPDSIGRILKGKKTDMFDALPTPIRVFESVESEGKCPVTVREGKEWLLEFSKTHTLDETAVPKTENRQNKRAVIEVKEVFYRYERTAPDVIKNLNLTLYEGEFLAVLGGNGTGKTTAISLIAGLNRQQRGEILINGKRLSEMQDISILGVIPQEVKSMFSKKTVFDELMDMTDRKLPQNERETAVFDIARLCRIEDTLKKHPYDISGGEQERVALGMVLLKKPQILIMDEPTKGMDAHFKKIFSQILKDLQRGGASILMVSHDLEFCAEFADRCALFFDGSITAEGETREFVKENRFYTTSVCRMAREILPTCVTARDLILAVGGKIDEKKEDTDFNYTPNVADGIAPEKPKKKTAKGIFCVLASLVLYLIRLFGNLDGEMPKHLLGAVAVVLLWCGLSCLLPQKELFPADKIPQKTRLTKRTLFASFLIVLVIPLTIFFGVYYLGDRKYYFISLLIVLETLLPFFAMFENRKAEAREIVLISVLCALGVAGRIAFFMVPEFKPLLAVVILSGICLGGEVGFLVGAMTAFLSNFFFGQGTWTQWQMFALGIIGFLAGVLFQKGILKKTKLEISAFGFFSALVIYGGIMNPASVFMVTANPTKAMIYSAFLMGLPIDMVHALSTSFFLWFLSEPFIEKIERIKTKYGLLK